MKIVIIVSCLLATAAAISTEDLNKYLEAWKDPIEKCAKQNRSTNLTPQKIFEKEVKDGVASNTCLHACVLRSIGVLKFSRMDGQKLGEYAESIFADQPKVLKKLKQAIVDCAARVTHIKDECTMAYLYAQCYLSTN